jgi:serine/threonine protein phosphatase PrpC
MSTRAHADAHYAIGASHLTCQDYALAETGDFGAYAIVADGCSSSANSDVGARLLASSAARMLRIEPNHVAATAIVEGAVRAAEAVALEPVCLDATLMWAHIADDEVRVTVSGDGVVAAVREDGSIESWSIEYDRAAPAYLSYLTDESRLVELVAMGQTRRIERRSTSGVATHEGPLAREPYLFELAIDRDHYSLVALLSDGARSFVSRTGEPVSLERVLAELLDFKSLAGQFVARRMRRFLTKQCSERGWSARDDLAVAALVTGGTP